MPPRPPLTDQQTEAALNAYYSAREQAVRYVLSALDATAFDAPALPYPEVLTRVQALIAAEVGRYAVEAETPQESDPPPPAEQEEQAHG